MDGLHDKTWRFINDAPIVGSQQALDDLFAETLSTFGVNRFDCGRMAANGEARPRGVLSGRGLTAWIDYCAEQHYLEVDPCRAFFQQVRGAFTWSDVKAQADDATAAAMWSDARADGMREGLVVPTMPRLTIGAVVRLVTPEPRFHREVIPLLQSISAVYATATQYFSDDAPNKTAESEPAARLTERELQCLHWAVRGKTNYEIGVILNISRHTVNTHIEGAKTKLGVNTRAQAAAIAHRLGLLSIA